MAPLLQLYLTILFFLKKYLFGYSVERSKKKKEDRCFTYRTVLMKTCRKNGKLFNILLIINACNTVSELITHKKMFFIFNKLIKMESCTVTIYDKKWSDKV